MQKALDEIYGQTLQILGFLNIGNMQFFFNEICDFIPSENTYEGSLDARSDPRDQP